MFCPEILLSLTRDDTVETIGYQGKQNTKIVEIQIARLGRSNCRKAGAGKQRTTSLEVFPTRFDVVSASLEYCL